MESSNALIAGHPFLAGLKPQFLPIFERCGSTEHYRVGETIFREGQFADRFYLIHRGVVALHTFSPATGEKTIQTLKGGEALGWSWLLQSNPKWHFTASPQEDTEVIAFAGSKLREEAEKDPAFGYDLALRISRILLERLQATRARVLDLQKGER